MKNINEKDFSIITRVANNISRSKRLKNSENDANTLPTVIGIKLTNKCNLRCKHCYEWNEQGYHNNMDIDNKNAEIDFGVLEKAIEATKKSDAMFYLWGGEPLLYGKINQLLSVLQQEKRYVVICTNAILLPQYYDLICRFEENIELLIALDGDLKSNDALRGKGVYNKVIKVIKDLISLKNNCRYKGKISVHTMISNENIDSLIDYVLEMDTLGIDDLILCLPWYISEDTSKIMDDFCSMNIPEVKSNIVVSPSWYAYKYKIKNYNIIKVHKVIDEIRKMSINMNIQFQPDLSGKELTSFLRGEEIINCDNRECLTIYSRLDILPTGKVTFCKHFQELEYGDLNNNSVEELWNSVSIKKFRNILKNYQMPVCSKCNNLYRNSYKPINKNSE